MKESEIQKQCLNYLQVSGFFAWKNHVGSIPTHGRGRATNPAAGSPDIMAIKNGLFYAIEVKTPTGKVSKHQYGWLEKAHKHGAIAMVVRSLDDLITCLDKMPDELKMAHFPFALRQ